MTPANVIGALRLITSEEMSHAMGCLERTNII